MNGVKHLKGNMELSGLCRFVPNVLFSYASGKELRMQLLLPTAPKKPSPLLVFLQGSGWTYPDVNVKLPMFAKFAEDGIAVAMIVHRNRNEGFAAPAFLEDAKTAVRFLRAHAKKFNIDKENIFFGGSSSGGNTALLMGQTAGDERYVTDEWRGESDAVRAVIDACGPTDLLRFASGFGNTPPDKDYLEDSFVLSLCSKNRTREERAALLDEISPERVYKRNRINLPTLILHGTEDEIVPLEESDSMYQTLIDGGCDAEYVQIDGAMHDSRGMWSREIYDEVERFILKHIG